MSTYRVGLDIGSTTCKIVVLDNHSHMVFSRYKRHQANVAGVLREELKNTPFPDRRRQPELKITGSVGMGVAEKFDLPFVQEVIAATKFVKPISGSCNPDRHRRRRRQNCLH